MTTVQKLNTIRQISGLSQEKLAQRFGVSFASFNAWINGRTKPRKKTQLKIDSMFLELTGQKQIDPAFPLTPPGVTGLSKKQNLVLMQKQSPPVLKTILGNPDIYDRFVLSLTYHSNRIEGNSMTEPETAAILFDNSVIPNKNLIEHLEVKNHQTALHFLLNHMEQNTTQPSNCIDEHLVLKLHEKLMNGIRRDAGFYRNHSVRIVGADVPTANYVKVPALMKDLFESIVSISDDVLHQMAEAHSRFEQIHPFSDGNGRIGRLLLHAMALRSNLPPAVIRQQEKQLYYTFLNKAQQTQHEDVSLLTDFICDAIMTGFRFLERKD